MGAETMRQLTCPWCGSSFTPRMTGGKPQRFCSTHCRRSMDAGLRVWAQDQLDQGKVTVAELKRIRCEKADRGPRNNLDSRERPSSLEQTRALS